MDCQTVLSRLKDARNAYHLLLTGQQANIVVDNNGERVQYTAANRSDLLHYIQSLESEAAACGLQQAQPSQRFAIRLTPGF